MNVHFSSKKLDWQTPDEIYFELNSKYRFDFDPCPVNPSFDGLSVEWGQSNFVNPPYGRELPKWVEKGFEEAKKGKTIVLLIPARTDTKIWHRYILPFCCPPVINQDVCWVAGIVDGEGCISIQKHKPLKSSQNTTYGLRIGVKMTHLPTVEKIMSIFSTGKIYEDHTNPRIAYKWETRTKNAYSVLRSIYPYLLTKRKEAFLAIDFYSGYISGKLLGPRKLPQKQIDRSEEYYNLLRQEKRCVSDIFPVEVDIRFIKGRLKFKGAKNFAPFPSAVVAFNGDLSLKQ